MATTLRDICYVRSGDKGDTACIGLVAKSPGDYALLLRSVTPATVKQHLGDWVRGPVHCYPMDNIGALMIVAEQAMDGGATKSLRLDQTGKALGQALLRLLVNETEGR